MPKRAQESPKRTLREPQWNPKKAPKNTRDPRAKMGPSAAKRAKTGTVGMRGGVSLDLAVPASDGYVLGSIGSTAGTRHWRSSMIRGHCS